MAWIIIYLRNWKFRNCRFYSKTILLLSNRECSVRVESLLEPENANSIDLYIILANRMLLFKPCRLIKIYLCLVINKMISSFLANKFFAIAVSIIAIFMFWILNQIKKLLHKSSVSFFSQICWTSMLISIWTLWLSQCTPSVRQAWWVS